MVGGVVGVRGPVEGQEGTGFGELAVQPEIGETVEVAQDHPVRRDVQPGAEQVENVEGRRAQLVVDTSSVSSARTR
jgi:hypothetical protein